MQPAEDGDVNVKREEDRAVISVYGCPAQMVMVNLYV